VGVDVLVVVRVGFGLETHLNLVEGLGQVVGERLRLVEAPLDDLQRLNGFGFGLGSIGRLTAAGTECQDRGNREGWNELRSGLHGPQPIGVRHLLSSRVRRLRSEPLQGCVLIGFAFEACGPQPKRVPSASGWRFLNSRPNPNRWNRSVCAPNWSFVTNTMRSNPVSCRIHSSSSVSTVASIPASISRLRTQ